jgi:hypothetical protein
MISSAFIAFTFASATSDAAVFLYPVSSPDELEWARDHYDWKGESTERCGKP